MYAGVRSVWGSACGVGRSVCRGGQDVCRGEEEYMQGWGGMYGVVYVGLGGLSVWVGRNECRGDECM